MSIRVTAFVVAVVLFVLLAEEREALPEITRDNVVAERGRHLSALFGAFLPGIQTIDWHVRSLPLPSMIPSHGHAGAVQRRGFYLSREWDTTHGRRSVAAGKLRE